MASAKDTNVLYLLNALYTSGFASMSPTVPRLTSRLMHTLYAISFIVYSTSSLIDWIHTYAVLRGSVTSFPLEDWFVVMMVVISVTSSMLTVLLLVLCVENAFAYRVHIAPYRTGLAVICEAFIEWVHSFNNFRVAFLFSIFHDGAMTVVNFFFIASCRCAVVALDFNAFKYWNSMFSNLETCYAVFRLPENGLSSKNGKEFKCAVKNSVVSDGGRMWQFDETWPMRFSIERIYGQYPIKTKRTLYFNSNGTANKCLSFMETVVCYSFTWVCHAINFREQTIQAHVVPYIGRLGNATNQEDVEWICKPIWENPMSREQLHTGPWQAIATMFVSNYTVVNSPTHTIFYDYIVLAKNENDENYCIRGSKTNWKFVAHLERPPIPYFIACKQTIQLYYKTKLIHC
ncbi:hypothetical protein M3Y97_00151800 [Aphelenchoides bicaudatus]|nr:hypothetical protein M3Y97_00151800 [Aphelenchoides bicaudatus]